MSKNLNKKIVVVGAGYWGTIIVNTLFKLNYKNIYVIDKNKFNLKIISKRFRKLNTSTNYLNFVKDNSFKTFLFATPPSVNFNLCKLALLNKKDVFIEKPVVKRISQLKQLIKISNQKNSMFMTGYVYCFNDYIKYIKKIIISKKLGKILYIDIQRKNLGPIRSDVSSSFDLSSHDLSILFYLFNKIPKIVNYNGNAILKKKIFDNFNGNFKINNIKVNISSSWLYPEKVRKIIIVGSKKMLVFDELNEANKILIFNKYAYYPKINYFKNILKSEKARVFHGKSYSPKILSKPPLINELKYFFSSLLTRKKVITDGNFALKILKVLNKI